MKVDTIEQFKIKEWIEKNFETGSLQIEYPERNKAVATDKAGQKIEILCTKQDNEYIVTYKL